MTTKVEMEAPETKSDTDRLPIINQKKSAPINFIEWNVDMNVTVGSVKRSKMFQRSRALAVLVLAITFAVMLSHIKREIKSLQVQMHLMNTNILILMSKYDKLNRNLNRVWIHRHLKSHTTPNARYFVDSSWNVMKKNDLRSLTYNERVYRMNYEEERFIASMNNNKTTVKDIVTNDHEQSHNKDEIPHHLETRDSISESRQKINLKRSVRSIIPFNKSNSTVQVPSRVDDDINDREPEDDSVSESRESRTARSRRDNEGRGPLVATFVGAVPEQHFTDAVYIGPWVKSIKNDSQYNLNKFHLVEDKRSIEVTTNGLYMISAQIFYFGESTNYSYWILLSSEGTSTTQKLVKCAAAAAISAAEVSCHTSVVTPLRRGDRLHIQQQERNRFINMREGHSYMQLVLLSNSNGYRRRST